MPARTGVADVRRERSDDLVVGAHRSEEQQPGVVVEHRQPGGVLLPPGEINAQVAHFRSLHPWLGSSRADALDWDRSSYLVVAVAVGTTAGAPAGLRPRRGAVAAAAPVHQISVTGTGVGTYPAFDPSISRYGVTTTAATGGTLTVTATTSDPAGVVTVNGRTAPGGTRTLTGLSQGDEVAVFITDSAGTARHSFVYLPPQFPTLERVTPDPAPGPLRRASSC